MAYQRKTKDVWHIQVYYTPEYGYETVCTEDTYSEAKKRYYEYKTNCPEYYVRLKKAEKGLVIDYV